MAAILDFEGLPPGSTAVAFVVFSVLSIWVFVRGYVKDHRRRSSNLPPEVPGLPVLGNLLLLKEKKPHKTFAKWAETYGPIYSIRTGANTVIVLNTSEVAKEALVTRFACISTRKVSSVLKIITSDKTMVAMSDYDEFHKTVKRHILTNLLAPSAQKRHRIHRDNVIQNTVHQLHALLKNNPLEAVNLRKIFESELFGLALNQALGKDFESIYVDDLGTTLSRKEIFKVLVKDPMAASTEVDRRDFFPYLKWIPNKSFETRLQKLYVQRHAVMKALIKEQKKRVAAGEEVNCYLDYLLSEAATLSERELAMLIWESIIESTDTTLATTEWAMYALAKDPKKQDRLYEEIQSICGSDKITEEKLSQLPYLNAVFHETLRNYSPVPLIPLRYVHEDTELGGYHVPAGSEISINIYGCHMDKKVWDNPKEWKPERFLDGKYDPLDMHKTMGFGGGKRMCAGSLQAILISCTLIGRLVQEFYWTLKDGEEANINTLAVTTHKLHPMQAIIKPRNQERN